MGQERVGGCEGVQEGCVQLETAQEKLLSGCCFVWWEMSGAKLPEQRDLPGRTLLPRV